MTLPAAEGGTGSLNAAALAERQRLLAAQAAERKRLQDAAKHMGGEDKQDLQKSIQELKPDVIAKDTFVGSANVGTTKDDRQALYAKFNTDGQDGLSDAEFDAAFNANVADTKAEAAADKRFDDMAPPDAVYEVDPGDNLSKIAGSLGKNWQELYQYGDNAKIIGNDPNQIQIGQKLQVPADWVTDPKAVDAAKGAIDQLPPVSPERATGGSPDRIDEQKQRDVKAMGDAQAALAQIPKSDPQRADYQQKVADLTKTVEHKWMMDAAGQDAIKAEQTINQITDEKPDAASNSVNGQCMASPQAFRDAVNGNVTQMREALGKIAPDDPAYATFKAKVDGYEADAKLVTMQSTLNEKAGHPVEVTFGDNFSDADKAREYKLLQDSLADPSFDGTWKKYDKIEFNTYTQYHNDSDKDNLNKYTEVDDKTLKINNPAKDGITDAEYDKQVRALAYTRDHGKGS
jgi:hypothetical protein